MSMGKRVLHSKVADLIHFAISNDATKTRMTKNDTTNCHYKMSKHFIDLHISINCL